MANQEKKTMATRWQGLKDEFAKITWPEKSTVGKQSTAVVIVSVVIGLIIVVIDMIVQYGVDFLVNL